ncbi:MAG TPA: carboxypeptidase-like regulatory domain-containing protein [archaeon]|nr:carboxypeptidase-like regulatory domain-containing protein [archaeon]
MKNFRTLVALAAACCLWENFLSPAFAEYAETPHRSLSQQAIPVAGPGRFDQPGATYVLARDISSAVTPVFLGKDVTLDLNGYTITYAAGGYSHVPNYGFEEDLEGWDTSRAPGAKVEDTDKVQIFIGKKILRLRAGDEIVSGYVSLPVAGRSYFAMCGVATWEMKVSLYVENGKGKPVRCMQDYGDSIRVCCPVQNRSPRLGGGFVTAHLHGLPAGSYRIRVRAETDCLVDHIDIRPAMDAGIAVVEDTYPWAHNDNLYAGDNCAFFDYTKEGSASEPVPAIPRVRGAGTITIKNGVIRSGVRGILSWGIQSTAKDVKIRLENIKISASGINTNAVDIPQAEITDCRFEIDTPFIINRHKSEHAVVIRSLEPSIVSHCEFIGGQGCLTVFGRRSLVHDNLFVNRQTVTNHYCVMARGDSSRIYDNRFEPEIGSGIEIFRHKFIEIYNNTFRIEAAPPSCEYGHEEYSTTAVRIADYDAGYGSPQGCDGNRVYNNKFHIIGRDYPQYPDYIPMAWAFFHSASGGETYVYDNEIVVEHRDPGSKALAAAVYIGGAASGGEWYNNRITTNVYAFWVGSWYGMAENARIYNNTIIKAPGAPGDFKPVRMGFLPRQDAKARNIEFRSNVIEGAEWGIDATDQDHSYSVYWTLKVKVADRSARPVPEAGVLVMDRSGQEAERGKTGQDGLFSVELLQYAVDGKKKEVLSPYTIKVGRQEKTVDLNKNTEVTLILE